MTSEKAILTRLSNENKTEAKRDRIQNIKLKSDEKRWWKRGMKRLTLLIIKRELKSSQEGKNVRR